MFFNSKPPVARDSAAGLSDAAFRVAQHLRRPSLPPVAAALAGCLVEAGALGLVLWFALFSATDPTAFAGWPAARAAVLAALVSVAAGHALGAYRFEIWRCRRVGLHRLLPGILAAGALAPLMVAAPVEADAYALALAIGFIGVLLPLRLGLGWLASWTVDHGLTERRAIIAGGGAPAEDVIRGLAARPDNDIRVVAIFDGRGPERVGETALHVPRIGDWDEMVRFCRVAEVDLIIISLPAKAEARIAQLLKRFAILPVPVYLSAFTADFAFRRGPGGGLAALLPASYRPEQRLVKRLFDLSVAASLLVLLSPLLLAIAVAVAATSRGPILFRQSRHGFNERAVLVWKFRTMYVDQCDVSGRQVVSRGDPRVTPLGRFLRKSSLDELPQLFNVVQGSLSLVGPRPHALDARSSQSERFAEIVEDYSARHRLPPGITGWAQINGWRGEVTEPDELRARMRHDLWYIENWSLWLDIKILLQTPRSLVRNRKAY